MTLNFAIGAAILGGISAGLACYASHGYANARRWRAVHRYTFGIMAILIPFAICLFVALTPEMAAGLTLCFVIIASFAGFGTWLNYQPGKHTISDTPDADEALRKLDDELSH